MPPAPVQVAGPAPLVGVARATGGRRCLAYALDLVPFAVLLGVTFHSQPTPWWWLAAGTAVVLVLQLLLLARGLSIGRVLMRQRTVDDLTGTPVRLRRLVAQLAGRGARRSLTADLRAGRDPLQPLLADLTGSVNQVVVEPPPSPPQAPASPRETGLSPVAGSPLVAASVPSVSIMLANGERYEIFRSLLLGRSPTDTAGGGHALLAWPDLSRRLAKTHALLEWSGDVLWVTDLHTVTGTTLVSATGDRRVLAPRVRAAAPLGSTIECGGRSLKVVPSV